MPRRTVQPVFGPDFGQLIQQGLGAFGQVKGLQRQEAAEERRVTAEQQSNMDRFAKESMLFSAEIGDLSLDQQILKVRDRITDLGNRGIDSAESQRLLDGLQSGDQAQVNEMQDVILQRRELGYQTGELKRPPAPKQAKGKWRIATPEEKTAAGITDKVPYQISNLGKFVRLGEGKGQTFNFDLGKWKPGKIPSGQALVERDGQPTLIDIPGGPQAKEAIRTAERKEGTRQTTARTANIVKEDIGRFRKLIEDQVFYDPVTGPTGSLASNIPGTARKDAEALKTTIGANVGFDRLQAMRESSKTGGALGAISEREMKQLESVMGSIELTQSPEQLSRNLDRLDKIYDAIIKKASAYPNASQFGFESLAKPVSQITSPVQGMTQEQAERYK